MYLHVSTVKVLEWLLGDEQLGGRDRERERAATDVTVWLGLTAQVLRRQVSRLRDGSTTYQPRTPRARAEGFR